MTVEEAMKEMLKGIEIYDTYADFSKLSDERLLQVHMNTELSNLEEVERFITELKRRQLYDIYFESRVYV